MATVLTTPVVETLTATTVQITGFVNNIEEERCEIHYILLTDAGEPTKRGQVVIGGNRAIDPTTGVSFAHAEVKALYAETDAVMATGKTFEVASGEILYSKVWASL